MNDKGLNFKIGFRRLKISSVVCFFLLMWGFSFGQSDTDTVATVAPLPDMVTSQEEKLNLEEVADFELEAPKYALSGVESELVIRYTGPNKQFRDQVFTGRINGEAREFEFVDGEAVVTHSFSEAPRIEVRINSFEYGGTVAVIP